MADTIDVCVGFICFKQIHHSEQVLTNFHPYLIYNLFIFSFVFCDFISSVVYIVVMNIFLFGVFSQYELNPEPPFSLI